MIDCIGGTALARPARPPWAQRRSVILPGRITGREERAENTSSVASEGC